MPDDSIRPIAPSDVFAPEFYADSLQIGSNPWGFVFQYGLASPDGARPVCTVRMSPQHAKVMGLLLKRMLGEWEQGMGQEITFPEQLRRELNIPDEL